MDDRGVLKREDPDNKVDTTVKIMIGVCSLKLSVCLNKKTDLIVENWGEYFFQFLS